MGQRCTASKQDGTPCKAWAIPNTDPPRCSAHHHDSHVGAPPGNSNALTHGAYQSPQPGSDPPDLHAIINDLNRRLSQLSAYIDANLDLMDPNTYVRLSALQGQLAGRVSRLLKDAAAIAGQADELSNAINDALDDLSRQWGVEL